MKNFNKLNTYTKISLICAVGAFLSQCALFIFVLLPTYSLVRSSEPNPELRLEDLSDLSRLLTLMVYILLISVLVLGVIGHQKMKRDRKHDRK